MKPASSRPTRILICIMVLLALTGTAGGKEFVAGGQAGIVMPDVSCAGDLLHADGHPGMLPGSNVLDQGSNCHFPLWNLPAYYVCIMVCRIGKGGDACPGRCERMLSVCD